MHETHEVRNLFRNDVWMSAALWCHQSSWNVSFPLWEQIWPATGFTHTYVPTWTCNTKTDEHSTCSKPSHVHLGHKTVLSSSSSCLVLVSACVLLSLTPSACLFSFSSISSWTLSHFIIRKTRMKFDTKGLSETWQHMDITLHTHYLILWT